MILVDSGPLIALFEPRDSQHQSCSQALSQIAEPLVTTIPVLTEAFHLLRHNSLGAVELRRFIKAEAMSLFFLESAGLMRAFELMDLYADCPMDFADASLIVAAERMQISRIFTLDRRHFQTYRLRRGHRQSTLEILP